MNSNVLRFAVTAILGGSIALPASAALQLYVDSKTGQVYTTPGPGRSKLGNFEQVEDRPAKTSKGYSASSLNATSDIAASEEIHRVEKKLNARIDSVVNKPKPGNEAVAKFDDKGFRWESNDGNFKFKAKGRLHTDGDMYSGGDITTVSYYNSKGQPLDEPVTDDNRLTDGTEIRRMRLTFEGTFYQDWHFKLQPEYANGGADGSIGIRDAFVKYTGFGDGGNWTVGQTKQPYSFQQMMSSNDMLFMERSTEYEFTNRNVNRAIGLRYENGGDWWGISTGLFGDTATRQASGTTSQNDEGWGAAIRGTLAPWFKPDELFHIGASGAFRAPRSGDRTVSYRIKPTAIAHVTYLDTGKMNDIENSQFINAEMVGVYGPLSIETEYNATWINGDSVENTPGDPAGDGFMHGAHVDVGYTLTGESRATSYNAYDGVLGRLKPNHKLTFSDDGWGAWELKGRFMWIDMNQISNSTLYAGGSQVASTFGVNWYFNNWSRFMVDWTHVYSLNVGKAGVGREVANIPGNSTGDWDYIQARVQLAY